MKKQRPHNKVPPGWLDCPPFGQEIGYLVPSKVPLGEAFNDYIPPGKTYSYWQVIHQQRVLGRKLGLVIDLTNSNRYYSTNDWKKEGIEHVKIACKGHDSVPGNEAVNAFVYEVLQFLARQKHSKRYILVHCTHGHNRTGYMIIHFLMRTVPISVTQAIKIFSDARPPGIYRPGYIDALYNFYHEKKPDMACPRTPEWKRSSELDLNGDAMPDHNDGGPPAAVQESEVQLVMTNDDILGDDIPEDQQDTFQQFCYQTLKLSGGGRGMQQFPGSHPVSLSRDNFQLLRQRYYYATWKADGTRYMMLITMDGCYLIDRSFRFRRVQMRFPCNHSNEALAVKFHHFTLLDGEMIIDTVPDSQKQERSYLIYDMMAINQVSIVERPFYERWKMIEREVIEPRNKERQYIHLSKNPDYRYEMEPFRVKRKDFWLLSTVTKLLKDFIPKLSHEADGLIFQCWDDPYVPRTHEGLLKWKYPEMNSVDFLFEIVESHESLYLHERGKKKLMEGNRVVFPDGSDPSTFSGKIIECSWDSEEEVWVCMRVRSDKGTPNEFNTYRKVMRSIRDNITEDAILDEINKIICLPMYATGYGMTTNPTSILMHHAEDRLFNRERTIHQILGGGVFADVILWRQKNLTVGILVVTLASLVVLERSGYTLVSLTSSVFLLLFTILFLWAKSAAILSRPAPPLPHLHLSEETMNEAANFIRNYINALLSVSEDIALGRDSRMFIKVSLTLSLICVIGGLTDFLTLIYTGLFVVLTVPALYERHEDHIERYVLTRYRNLQWLYVRFD